MPEQAEDVNPVVAPHVPAGQLVQDDAPAVEYFPRPQIVHPAAPLVPELITDPA